MENVAQLPLLFAADLEDLLASDTARLQMEKEALPAYLVRQRWYRSKTRNLVRAFIKAWTRFPAEAAAVESSSVFAPSVFALLQAEFEEGEPEVYVLPLATLLEDGTTFPPEEIICRLSCHGGKLLLIDAILLPRFRAALLKMALNKTGIALGDGVLSGQPLSGAYQILAPDAEVTSHLVSGEQSNTSTLFTDHFFKLYRRLDEGTHPEPEMLRFLARVRYPHVPAFHSTLEWERAGQPSVSLGLVQKRIEAEGNGWDYVLEQLVALFQTARNAEQKVPMIPQELVDWVQLLGRRTAGLHMALGSRPGLPDFAPEPISPEDLADVRSAASRLLKGALAALGNRPPKDLQALRTAMSRLERLESVLVQAGEGKLGSKTRVHGDFHLGQIMKEHREVWFLDFEGEPTRSLAEKRRKHSPLRDVAGMLRSFHYAAHAASLKRIPGHFQTVFSETNIPLILSELFLEAYYDMLAGSDLLPQDSGCRTALLDLFVLEKAVYELHYELNNRPDWVDIPLRGLTTLGNP